MWCQAAGEWGLFWSRLLALAVSLVVLARPHLSLTLPLWPAPPSVRPPRSLRVLAARTLVCERERERLCALAERAQTRSMDFARPFADSGAAAAAAAVKHLPEAIRGWRAGGGEGARVGEGDKLAPAGEPVRMDGAPPCARSLARSLAAH